MKKFNVFINEQIDDNLQDDIISNNVIKHYFVRQHMEVKNIIRVF